MAIDKNSLLPLYHQVEEAIRKDISAKIYIPGQTIPTETELQKQYNVSRETIRKAVTNLVLSGLLEKRKGVGTFVTQPKIIHNTRHIYGSNEEIIARGMIPNTRFIEKKEILSTATMREEMFLKNKTTIIKAKRLRLVNDEPVAILSSYLPSDLVPDLATIDFRGDSLYKTLEEIYNFKLTKGDEVIEAGAIGEKDAILLEIKRGTPILVVRRLTYLDNGRVIEKLTALYRSDKFKYQVKLVGRP